MVHRAVIIIASVMRSQNGAEGANAKAKAEILTKASGVTLGELVSIDYNWGELHLYSPTRYEIDPPCMARASATPTAMDIEPDDIDVTDSVTFVWEIR